MYGQTEASPRMSILDCVRQKIKLIVLEMQSTKINFI